ncbi:MAG: hypothetical protein NC349_02135 [Paenibacillus sp.]|nr:hypothetical protein [Paenibacillus sp.]
MKYYFTYLGRFVALMSIMFVSACSSDNDVIESTTLPSSPVIHEYELSHETGEEYDIYYKFNEKVIRLTQTDVTNYVRKVEDDSILYLSTTTPLELLPAKGSIYSIPVTDKTPYGLGNRVVSVTAEQDLYKCVTTSIPLDEIFDELSLTSEVLLIPENVPSMVEDTDGNTHPITLNRHNKSRVQVGATDVLTLNLNYSKDAVTIGGDITFGSILTLNFDIKNKTSECSLAVYSGIDGNIELSAKWWEESKYKRLLPKTGALPIYEGAIVWGPLVFRPYVEVELGYEGSVEGSISTGFTKSFGAKFGIKNNIGFSENLTDDNSNIFNDISVDAKAELNLVLKVDFGLGLFTKNIASEISPNIKAGFSTECNLNNTNIFKENPSIDFDFTANADVLLYAYLFGHEFAHAQENLATLSIFSHKWHLLPTVKENSFSITDNASDNTYNAKYSLSGGLLTLFHEIYPAMRVFDDDNEVYTLISDANKISYASKEYEFNLKNLENDKTYSASPAINLFGKIYEHDPQKFSRNELVGTWKETYEDGYSIITFNADGTWNEEDHYDVIDTFYGTYTLDTDRKILYKHCLGGSDGPFESEFFYKIIDNKLYLEWTDGDDHNPGPYTRVL